jgi:hypothetical protein
MKPKLAKSVEACLHNYGWRRNGSLPQFLQNDNQVRDEIVFYHDSYNASVFALGPLINRFREEYAVWGFYEGSVLDKCGYDDADLLAFLAKLKWREFKEKRSAPQLTDQF